MALKDEGLRVIHKAKKKKRITFLGTGDGCGPLWVSVSFLNLAQPKATLRFRTDSGRRKKGWGKPRSSHFCLRESLYFPSTHPDVSHSNFRCANLKRFL